MTASSRDALARAFAAFSGGNLVEAARLCDAVLAREPRDGRALELAAAIALMQGNGGLALDRAQGAVACRPSSATAYQTRGQVLRSQGRAEEAERDFLKATQIDGGFADAHASLGALRVVRGDFAGARPHLERAVASQPRAAEWRYNLAICDVAQERLEAAHSQLRQALQARPGWPEALAALGAVLVRLERGPEALAALKAALALDPSMPQAWNNAGVALLAQGRAREAAESFRRWAELAPGEADPLWHLGNALRSAGDPRGAQAAYREALAIRPDSAPALQNLGNLLREAGRNDEALAMLERAVAVSGSAESHFSLSLALLAAGQLERGWREYAWRLGSPPEPEPTLREALRSNGRAVLQGEQGLGDQLFFLRWAPEWSRSNVRLQWDGDARVAPFAASVSVAALDESQPCAARVFVGDLPRLASPGSAAHPPPVALEASASEVEAARSALQSAGAGPYVAVAWRAGLPAGGVDEKLSKNVPLAGLADVLARWPGTIVCVQRDPHPGELELLRSRSGRPVLDASSFNGELRRMAGLLCAVDAYAGVSSTNVHIAAGVGLAAHILVPYPPEWRYAGGDESPWFPGYALHREDPSTGWTGAFEQLGAALAAARP
ncbi:MAG TPA: tetratricopeptide repeat protein [Usitatibacter sp.]|nr:tetratricopeptide repeat protein [Usitatibacter sp.]